jgi:hypothetical protein
MKRRFLLRTRVADSLRKELTPAQRHTIALHLERRDPDAAVNSLCSASHRNALRLLLRVQIINHSNHSLDQSVTFVTCPVPAGVVTTAWESFMQSEVFALLTTVPPKPAYNPTTIFNSAMCADSIRTYNQATAPLQQQIASLNKLTADQQAEIKRLHEQMQADLNASLEAKSAAHHEGLQHGLGIGVGATLVLFALIFGIRRLMRNFTVKPQAHGASA